MSIDSIKKLGLITQADADDSPNASGGVGGDNKGASESSSAAPNAERNLRKVESGGATDEVEAAPENTDDMGILTLVNGLASLKPSTQLDYIDTVFSALNNGKPIDEVRTALVHLRAKPEGAKWDVCLEVLDAYEDALDDINDLKTEVGDDIHAALASRIAMDLVNSAYTSGGRNGLGDLDANNVLREYVEDGSLFKLEGDDYEIYVDHNGDLRIAYRENAKKQDSKSIVSDIEKVVTDLVRSSGVSDEEEERVESELIRYVKDVVAEKVNADISYDSRVEARRVLRTLSETGKVIAGKYQLELVDGDYVIKKADSSALQGVATLRRLSGDGALARHDGFQGNYQASLGNAQERFDEQRGILSPKVLVQVQEKAVENDNSAEDADQVENDGGAEKAGESGEAAVASKKPETKEMGLFDHVNFSDLSKSDIPEDFNFKFKDGNSRDAVVFFFREYGKDRGLSGDNLDRFAQVVSDEYLANNPQGIEARSDLVKLVKSEASGLYKERALQSKSPSQYLLAYLRQKFPGIARNSKESVEVVKMVTSWAEVQAIEAGLQAGLSEDQVLGNIRIAMTGSDNPYRFDEESFKKLIEYKPEIKGQLADLIDGLNARGDDLHRQVTAAYEGYQLAERLFMRSTDPISRRMAQNKMKLAYNKLLDATTALHNWYDDASEAILEYDADGILDAATEGTMMADVVEDALDEKAPSFFSKLKSVGGEVASWVGAPGAMLAFGVDNTFGVLDNLYKLGTGRSREGDNQAVASAYQGLSFGAQNVIQTEKVDPNQGDQVGSGAKDALSSLKNLDVSGKGDNSFDQAMQTESGRSLAQYAHSQSGRMSV